MLLLRMTRTNGEFDDGMRASPTVGIHQLSAVIVLLFHAFVSMASSREIDERRGVLIVIVMVRSVSLLIVGTLAASNECSVKGDTCHGHDRFAYMDEQPSRWMKQRCLHAYS